VDTQALALSGGRGVVLRVVDYGSTQIGLLDDLGILDTHRLQHLLPRKDGMGPITVDVQGRDVEARLVAGIL
jgi:hypothetical protein